jgi:hypothetical protein
MRRGGAEGRTETAAGPPMTRRARKCLVVELAVKSLLDQRGEIGIGEFARLLHPLGPLEALQGAAGVVSEKPVDTARLMAEERQRKLRDSHPYVGRASFAEGFESRLQLLWIPVGLGVLPIVSEGEIQPPLVFQVDA